MGCIHREKSEPILGQIPQSALDRLCSRFRVNETSQISERYSVHMKVAMKQRRLAILGQMYFSMIEYPKHDWHSAFGHKMLCYSRATAGTFILNLLYYSSSFLSKCLCIILKKTAISLFSAQKLLRHKILRGVVSSRMNFCNVNVKNQVFLQINCIFIYSGVGKNSNLET